MPDFYQLRPMELSAADVEYFSAAAFIGGKFSVNSRYLPLYSVMPPSILPPANAAFIGGKKLSGKPHTHNVARLPRLRFLASGEHCFFSPQKVEKFFLCATLFL